MKNLIECRKERAYDLATRIDRLAYLLDPYEYFDVVGRDEDSFQANVKMVARNLLSGLSRHYLDWLAFIAESSVDIDDRDRERAEDLHFSILNWYIDETDWIDF